MNSDASDLDSLLETYSARFAWGAVGIGMLRRLDSDDWDAVVVGNDLQPLVFWGEASRFKDSETVLNETGHMLHVLISTPPGVSPSGILSVPASKEGLPLGRLVMVVTADGETEVERPRDAKSGPAAARDFGPEMLEGLFAKHAKSSARGYAMAELDAEDGDKASVLLNWDDRPLLFWVDMPEPNARRELMVAVDVDGFVADAVAPSLRPMHGAEALRRLLAK